MRDLSKSEPAFFSEFKTRKNPSRYQEDCDDYDLREELRINLLSEQNNQCFYCEKQIGNDKKVHIDHIKQRQHYHALECDYNNFVLSCNGNGENYCGKYKDKQGKWEDMTHLNLMSEKASDFFDYVSNGKIKAKKALNATQTSKADTTITYLNLNHDDLVGARRNIFLTLPIL